MPVVSSTAGGNGSSRSVALPDRVTRNRRILRLYMVLYVVVSSALVAIAVVVGTYISAFLVAVFIRSYWLAEFVVYQLPIAPLITGALWLACAPAFAVWCITATRRPLKEMLPCLLARPVQKGELRTAKSALHDAVIASGIPMPRLAIIDCTALNAFVITKGAGPVWIGVTRGLTEQLSHDELRAVFAHLVARVRDGSATTKTLIAMLFAATARAGKAGDAFAEGMEPDVDDRFGAGVFKSLLGPLVFMYDVITLFLGISSAFILAGYQRAASLTAATADADAMMITRDPRGMLAALEKVLPADNRPGSVWDPRLREDVFGALFFAWPTVSHSKDPELIRIKRMRDMLGAAGASG